MSQPYATRSLSSALIGRSFVHPTFDYMLIGGGLSLAVTAIVYMYPAAQSIGYMSFDLESITGFAALPFIILISNSAHFASSTVRLYTKPDSTKALPFLTMAFPLVALAILTLCIFQAERMGQHLQALYLTWSPYHYAAQAYGLAVMYSYRSGCLLAQSDKKMLWWVCMLPFFFNFSTGHKIGLEWIIPSQLLEITTVEQVRTGVGVVLTILAFVTVLALFTKVWRSKSGTMPLISLLIIITNGIWWFVLPTLQAFVWATIFHGIQYLAIVIIFHLKDQMDRPDNTHGSLYHILWFYAASLLLGYSLFRCLPLAYVFAGFDLVESLLLVVAAINIHHFIVDAYIWRLKKSDSNRRVVDSAHRVPV